MKFEQPDPTDRSATTRFNRHVLVYRALLARAGFAAPSTIHPVTSGLFNAELIKAMADNTGSKSANYNSAAVLLDAKQTPAPSWPQVAVAIRHLADFMGEDDYKQFETWYVTKRPNASGDTWSDETLGKLLKMFQEANGPRTIGKALPQHTSNTQSDYAADIYNDLIAGRLTIYCKSRGSGIVNQAPIMEA